MPSENPTETSPLLSETSTATEEGANGRLNGQSDGISKPVDEEGQQQEDRDRDGQYNGLPDVKKQLKYIVPAVGIGVSCEERFREIPLTYTYLLDLSFSYRSDYHCF